MLRIPSKGPALYPCLCACALLAVVSFWLNPPRTISSPAQECPLDPPAESAPAVFPAATEHPETGKNASHLASLLRSRPAGDPTAMHALENLAVDPATAVATSRRLMAGFPDRANEIGTTVIGSLVRASQHTAALELAQAGPEPSRAEWLQLVLRHWAATEPDAGQLIVDQLRENGVSTATFELVAKSWASSAPAEFARYALMLPTGEHRSVALAAALEPWLLQDPAAVAACLPQLTEPSERDIFAAALTLRTDSALRPTQQALRWSESIKDPELRRTTLGQLIHQWSANDPDAALRYLATAPEFDADQQQALVAALTPPVDPL